MFNEYKAGDKFKCVYGFDITGLSCPFGTIATMDSGDDCYIIVDLNGTLVGFYTDQFKNHFVPM